MNPPGQTTLSRMRVTAGIAAGDIERMQDHLLETGVHSSPSETAVARRDDFHGIVRLIDEILSDEQLKAAVINKLKT